MQSEFLLGQMAGVSYRFHYSWPLALLLVVFSLLGFFQVWYPGWSLPMTFGVASVIGLIFALTMIIQCRLLILLLKGFGFTVTSGLLYALGYFPQENGVWVRQNSDWLTAVAGWILKVLFGAFFLSAATMVYGTSPARIPSTPFMVTLVWVGNLHLFLAGANLLPGYPLDGGRLLSAGLNVIMKNDHRSVWIAVQLGQILGILLICSGVMLWLASFKILGFWVMAIGAFMFQAAGFFKMKHQT